jgi:16S rRNA (guanine527-N7)-methyltransferase
MVDSIQLDQILGPSPHHGDMACQLNSLVQRFVEQGSVRGVTALKTAEQILAEFILDSLGGAASLPPRGRVIDIGTGGGVPGLVLAIVRPDLEFVLTDSASKKTTWVSETVYALQLKNVEVVTCRLEILGHDPEFRGHFEAVTAKALASLNVLLELAVPLLKVGGRLIAYKGPALTEELQESQFALCELGASVHRCTGYSVGGKCFQVCEIVKNEVTKERYPRRDGVPQKKPLSNSRKN